jgi:uncharacterized protein YpiB (UPF0302 family)
MAFVNNQEARYTWELRLKILNECYVVISYLMNKLINSVMFVKEVNFGEDGADILVSDGEHECYVFSYASQIQKGQKINTPLEILDTHNISKSKNLEVSITHQRSLSKYNYWIVARVVSVESGEISVGNLRMMLNNQLPGDVQANDIIEFAAERIDL